MEMDEREREGGRRKLAALESRDTGEAGGGETTAPTWLPGGEIYPLSIIHPKQI
jgi:hypothetical protein